MDIQKINWRTLEAFLGHNRYKEYLDTLFGEVGVTSDRAQQSEFLVSRATNFDNGAYTDLGCWNVVIYVSGYPNGWCIIIYDAVRNDQKTVIVTLSGSTTHNWRECGCNSCLRYRHSEVNRKY